MVPAVNRNRSSRGSKEESRDGETYGAEERGAGSHDAPGFCCCRQCNGTPPCRLDHHAFHQKKNASHDPDAAKLQDPACRKNPHEEHTRTLLLLLLLLPSPQCRLLMSTFPNASATLLPAATCTLTTSFPDYERRRRRRRRRQEHNSKTQRTLLSFINTNKRVQH